jgi:hypothetical protein
MNLSVPGQDSCLFGKEITGLFDEFVFATVADTVADSPLVLFSFCILGDRQFTTAPSAHAFNEHGKPPV